MPRFTADQLRTFARDLLAAGGAQPEEAECVAASLFYSNLRGSESHGIMRIPFYVDMLAKGDVVAGRPLEILRESAMHIVADGGWGFGQVQARRLLALLMERAREGAAGIGTLRCSGHIGRLGEYCELAAAEGMVSLLMVNTNGAVRRMAPPGGKSPRLGTNPIALGSPAGDEPMILDFSTSVTAEGKVRVKRIAGEACPPGWIIDSEGRPTTNPNDLYADPPGAILPMGGEQAYKGFGLAMMIEVFTGALAGGLCSREKPESPNGNCVFMLVARPEAFGGCEHFAEEVRRLGEFVRACPRVEGCGEILLPGDPERRTLRQRTAEGIPLDAENFAALVKLAERLQVKAPEPIG